MQSLLTNDELFDLASSVWSNILGLDLSRGDDAATKIGDRAVISSVQITGDWEGAVTIACARPLAVQLACAMFQMDKEDIDDEMMRDAMGEIANMTGGTVKGLTPGTNTLTLPTVAEGEQDAMSITGTQEMNCVSGSCCEGHQVVIRVLGKERKEHE